MMTGIVQILWKTMPSLLALLALGIGGAPVSAATSIIVKNNGPTPAEIGFDNAAALKVSPRGTAHLSLNDGDHSIQCRFEGSYDGCNIADRFTVEGARELTLNLIPFFTLPHAVALSQQGMLAIETRQDGAWATTVLEVPGAAEECTDYAAGKLAAVARPMRPRMAIRNATLATQNLCGRINPVIGTMVDGAQLYFSARFLTFKERNGRAVVVK